MTTLKSTARNQTMMRRQQLGLTIIELMITLVVAAILLTIAVPSMQAMIRNNRLTTQANTFVATLQYARSEAIKRRANLRILSADGTADWETGWRVWVDKDNDNTVDDEERLRVQEALSGGNRLTPSGGETFIEYGADGFVNAPFTADLCHEPGLKGRRISVSVTGRVTTERDYDC